MFSSFSRYFSDRALKNFVRLSLAILSLKLLNPVTNAAEGYQATGHLVLTSFDKQGAPTYRNVLIFEVRVVGGKWVIRTEPLFSKIGGIGFYESSNDTNACVRKVTAFKLATNEPPSPFESYRAELLSRNDFTPSHNTLTGQAGGLDTTSNSSVLLKQPRGLNPSTNSAKINNNGTAIIRKGQYPPADPSGCAVLWHAFVPPGAIYGQVSNNLMLQIWDDGHPNEIRFRQAKWESFARSPQLISNATFFWKGQKMRSDGKLEELAGSESSDASQIAANYVVNQVANLDGLIIPLEFALTRFVRSDKAHRPILSTVVASVASVSKLDGDIPSGPTVISNIFVNDYRMADREVDGGAFGYLLKAKPIPDVSEVTNSMAYKRHERSLRENNASKPIWSVRIALLLLLLVPPLFIGALLLRNRRRQ